MKNNCCRSDLSSSLSSPNLIIDAPHHSLTSEQLQFLRQGPTYVPPCQLHLSLLSSSGQSLSDILLQQSAPLRHQLTTLFSQLRTHRYARSMSFEEQIHKTFNDLFSSSIPSPMESRALHEQNLVQSIRKSLQRQHLILLRTADQQNMFYLERKSDFERQINDYLSTHMDLFEIMDGDRTVTVTTDEQQVQQMDQIVQKINTTLKSMHEKRNITEEQLKCLLIDRSKCEFPYLYFLPKIVKVSLFSYSLIVSCHCCCFCLELFHDHNRSTIFLVSIQSDQ